MPSSQRNSGKNSAITGIAVSISSLSSTLSRDDLFSQNSVKKNMRRNTELSKLIYSNQNQNERWTSSSWIRSSKISISSKASSSDRYDRRKYSEVGDNIPPLNSLCIERIFYCKNRISGILTSLTTEVFKNFFVTTLCTKWVILSPPVFIAR